MYTGSSDDEACVTSVDQSSKQFLLDHPGPSNTGSSDDEESVTSVDQSSKQYFWTILDQVTPEHPMYKYMQRRSINGHSDLTGGRTSDHPVFAEQLCQPSSNG